MHAPSLVLLLSVLLCVLSASQASPTSTTPTAPTTTSIPDYGRYHPTRLLPRQQLSDFCPASHFQCVDTTGGCCKIGRVCAQREDGFPICRSQMNPGCEQDDIWCPDTGNCCKRGQTCPKKGVVGVQASFCTDPNGEGGGEASNTSVKSWQVVTDQPTATPTARSEGVEKGVVEVEVEEKPEEGGAVAVGMHGVVVVAASVVVGALLVL